MSDTQQPNSIFADLPDDSSSGPDESEYTINEFGETVCSMTLELGTVGNDTGGKPSSIVHDVPQSIGRYQVSKALGRGAFGAVYLGHDDRLDREVAIKVPLIGAAGMTSKQVEESFLQEARQVACIQHPNVVTVHDVGVHAQRCFIVSEYLEGKDLNHWMIDHTP
ncbi:MAG: serine/threonine protein kinase, partial [Limisphaerales bacterium]